MSHKFNLYFPYLFPIYGDHVEAISEKLAQYKECTAEQVSGVSLNKYNNLLTYGRWYIKGPKDTQILDLVGVEQNIVDDTKK